MIESKVMEVPGFAYLVANAKTLIASSVVLSIVGVTPRVGLGRALALAWRSRIKTNYPLSVRKGDITVMKKSIADNILRGLEKLA